MHEALWPGLEFPRVPGHEVAGTVEKVGADAAPWQAGDRVGVGWHGGHCFRCERCRRGDFVTCANQRITGITHDGGYAEYLVAPWEALARIPDGLSNEEAAPLLCAGITVFNGLRNSTARPGDLVAVQGIGGLGHLAVQMAAQMGFRTVALSHGPDKEGLAKELGAEHFIDTKAVNAAEALADLGEADVLVATAPHAQSIADAIPGLGVDGELLLVAAAGDPVPLPAIELLARRRRVQGWPSGTATDSEDTLRFCAANGVRPHVETAPLAEAEAAYQKMMNGDARFRMVLTTG